MATKNESLPVSESYIPGRKAKRQKKAGQQQEVELTAQQRHKRRADSMAWRQQTAQEGANSASGKVAQTQTQTQTMGSATLTAAEPSAGSSEAKHQLQAWGYESSRQWRDDQEIHSGNETWLWFSLVLLLGLVLLFSQRQWLALIFPSHSSQQVQLSVQIHRVVQPGEELMVHAGKVQNPSPASDQTSPKAGNTTGTEGGVQLATVGTNNKVQNLLQRFDELLRIDVDEQKPDNNAQGQFRDVRLFFVKVEDDGQLQIKSVLHKVLFDQTPLSRTLEQLLKGPSPQEINKGLHSMLPPEMQILSIRIVNSTAFIDVSENFYEISQLPAVLLAAIKQLVFTVTEYPNIKSLRILVEGQPIFAENLPSASAKELEQKGINLNSELRREDLWQGEMGDFALES